MRRRGRGGRRPGGADGGPRPDRRGPFRGRAGGPRPGRRPHAERADRATARWWRWAASGSAPPRTGWPHWRATWASRPSPPTPQGENLNEWRGTPAPLHRHDPARSTRPCWWTCEQAQQRLDRMARVGAAGPPVDRAQGPPVGRHDRSHTWMDRIDGHARRPATCWRWPSRRCGPPSPRTSRCCTCSSTSTPRGSLAHAASTPRAARRRSASWAARNSSRSRLAERLGPDVVITGHARCGGSSTGPTASRSHADGLAVRARRVIVALAPTLAGRIVYDPPLPGHRDQLTQRTPHGHGGQDAWPCTTSRSGVPTGSAARPPATWARSS